MKILAIGAHLDDLELGCGGTLIKAIKCGHKVHALIMTDSSYQNYDGSTGRTRSVASQEGLAGIKEMGIESYDILDFKTKDVQYNSDAVEAVNKTIDIFKPDLILTHFIFDTHQDHRNTGLSTVSAGRFYNNILFYEPFPPSGRSYVAFNPQVYIDITDSLAQKLKALKCHRSQLKRYGGRWVESVKGRASLRGFECGYKYAEVFQCLRMEILK